MTDAIAEWTPAEWLAHQVRYAVGERVRLTGKPGLVTLWGDTGRVEALDPDLDGHYFVRLDTPAIYHGAGTDTPLPVIHEAWDNLERLDDAERLDA